MAASVAELPPSAKLVVKVLEYEAPLTQIELAEQTRLNRRTVRWALTRLENNGLIETAPNMLDARQTYYSLADGEMCNTLP